MQPLRLCVFLALVAVLRCYELSQNLAEFYCVLNGNFNDRKQVEKDDAGRTAIDLRVLPVFAPALSPVPVVYVEQYDAGILNRALILLIHEGADNITYATPNNFTGNTDIKRGTSDVTKVIKSLTPNDLQRQHNCTDVFDRVEPFVFQVNYENCNQDAADGQRGSYVSTNTCNGMHWVVPVGASEKPTLVPYDMQRHGNKYPLEAAPDNYVCNCDGTSE